MPDSKNIKFTFSLDQSSFGQVKSAIESLTSSLQKMNQAGGGSLGGSGANIFGGTTFGGANPGKVQTEAKGRAQQGGGQQQTMGKVILDNANAFKKFAQEGKDASKIMTEALKRDISSQEQSLDRLKSKLSSLNDEFTEATKKQKEFLAAGKSGDANAMGQYIKNVEGRIAETSGQTLQGAKTLSGSRESLQAIQPAGGGKFGQIASAMGYTGTGFGTGIAGALGGAGSLVAGLAAAAAIGVRETMAGSRMYSSAEANRGGFVNQEIDALRRGDLSSIQARRMILQDTAKRADLKQQMGRMSAAETVIGALGQTGKDILSTISFGASDVFLGGKGGGATGSAVGTAAMASNMAQKDRDQIEAQKRTADFNATRYATQYFQDTMASRSAAARLMGVGTGVDKRTGKGFDTYGDMDVALTRQGYDWNSLLAARSGLMAEGGKDFASKFGWRQMAASAAGQGGYGQAAHALSLSASGILGYGDDLMGLAMGAGKSGVKMDPQAAFQLANVVGGYDPRVGAVDPESLIRAYQSGINNVNDTNSVKQMMNVQAFAGGLNLGSQFTSGSLDSFQKGKNTIMAARVLGKGADTYAIDYLADLPMNKLVEGMAGGGDATANRLGVGKGQFIAYGNEVFGSMLDNFHGKGQIGAAVDKFKAAKASGQSIFDYLRKNPGEIGALKDAVNLGSGGGKEKDTSLALFQTLYGLAMDETGKKGGPGAAISDKIIRAANEAEAEKKKTDVKKTADMAETGELAADFKAMKSQREILQKFGTTLDQSAAHFTTALNNLADRINKTIAENRGYRGEPKGKKKQ